MTIEGLIATPFGYLLNGLYYLTNSYGFSLVIFALVAQAVMALLQLAKRPMDLRIAQDKAKIAIIRPQEKKLQEEYADDLGSEEFVAKACALYKDAGVNELKYYLLRLISGVITFAIPFLILVPIFQVVAQPITYFFHESPETANKIVLTIYNAKPELFGSGYNQVAAISHIQEFAELVKAEVPEVAAHTLQGIDYSFLGLHLEDVPVMFLLGFSSWVWDWAHIGMVLLPLLYIGRRCFVTVRGIYRQFKYYRSEKEKALAAQETPPAPPAPPVLPIVFLLLSLTAFYVVPIAANLYWLVSGLFAELLQGLTRKFLPISKSIAVQPIPADIKIEQEP